MLQVQATATPANTSDLTYQRWIKSAADMPLPPGGTNAQFRDPVQVHLTGTDHLDTAL